MPPRLVFYCHNVHGLGHIVRTSRIARAAVDAGAECLLITGCRALDRIPMDPRIAVASLPPVVVAGGRYAAADRSARALDVIQARAERIVEVCRDFMPHVVLADHSPLGLGGELVPLLTEARAEQWRTRFVWGLPYAEGVPLGPTPPANPRLRSAVAKYDSVIAYVPDGQRLFDSLPAWTLPARRTSVGIVADAPLPRVPGPSGLVVVACGGGGTAADLCLEALAARQRLAEPDHPPMRLVTGPLADGGAIRRAAEAAGLTDVQVEWRDTGELREVIRDASVVVSRAGYNSVALLLQTDLPVVLVPAAGGSTDQIARTSGSAWPGVHVVPLDATDRIDALARALEAAQTGPATVTRREVADGAARAAAWVLEEAGRP